MREALLIFVGELALEGIKKIGETAFTKLHNKLFNTDETLQLEQSTTINQNAPVNQETADRLIKMMELQAGFSLPRATTQNAGTGSASGSW